MNSPYPIVISFEMHACQEQQAKAAEHIESTIGLDKIYLLPKNWSFEMNLPSPEEMKYKFILKIKGNPRRKLELLNEKNKKKFSCSGSSEIQSEYITKQDHSPLYGFGFPTSQGIGMDGDDNLKLDCDISEHENETHLEREIGLKLKQHLLAPSLFKRMKKRSNSAQVEVPVVPSNKNAHMRTNLQLFLNTEEPKAISEENQNAFEDLNSAFFSKSHNSHFSVAAARVVQSNESQISRRISFGKEEIKQSMDIVMEIKRINPENIKMNTLRRHSSCSKYPKPNNNKGLGLSPKNQDSGSFNNSALMGSRTSKRIEDILQEEKYLSPDSGRHSSQNQISLPSERSCVSINENFEKTSFFSPTKIPKKYKPFQKIDDSLLRMTSLFGQKYINDFLMTSCSCASLKSSSFRLVLKNIGKERMVAFTKRQFLRIYPSSTRISSSNPDPISAWSVGSQLFALNFQTPDEPMLINTCKFLGNGGDVSGYILKPKYLRSTNLKPLPSFCDAKYEVSFKLISGQMIGTQASMAKIPKLEPFVTFQPRGIKLDQVINKPFISKPGEGNGFHTTWEGQKFEIMVRCPSFFFVVISVFGDKSNNKLSWMCLPFKSIRQGIRAVPLYDLQMNIIPHGKLLMKIKIKKLKDCLNI